MTACWEQVGAVLKANSLLSRGRLSIEASTRFHERTVAQLAPARLLTFAGAARGTRTPLGSGTVRAAITPTSLPDAIVDPGARRLAAPTGRFVRKTAAAAALDAGVVGVQLRREAGRAARWPSTRPGSCRRASLRPAEPQPDRGARRAGRPLPASGLHVQRARTPRSPR